MLADSDNDDNIDLDDLSCDSSDSTVAILTMLLNEMSNRTLAMILTLMMWGSQLM